MTGNKLLSRDMLKGMPLPPAPPLSNPMMAGRNRPGYPPKKRINPVEPPFERPDVDNVFMNKVRPEDYPRLADPKKPKSNPGDDMNRFRPVMPEPKRPPKKITHAMNNDMSTPSDDSGSLSSGYDAFKRKRRGILGSLTSSSFKLGG